MQKVPLNLIKQYMRQVVSLKHNRMLFTEFEVVAGEHALTPGEDNLTTRVHLSIVVSRCIPSWSQCSFWMLLAECHTMLQSIHHFKMLQWPEKVSALK